MADWRLYLASLPERTVRAAVALGGGAIREVGEVTLPAALRRSKLYQATVARLLRILVEGVGGVGGVYPAEIGGMSVRELTTRKAAGNVVELASILAMGWSPLWWLAAAADVSGGSKAYLRTLVGELETAKLLPPGTDVSSFAGLLSELETKSGTLADTIDVPPMNVADARTTWDRLRQVPAELPGPSDLAAIFEALQEAARREERSVSEVSAAVGLAAARAGLELGNRHIVDYYQQALREIAKEGLLSFLRRVTRPYRTRALGHFAPAAETYTGRALDWLRRGRGGARHATPGPRSSAAVAVGETPHPGTADPLPTSAGQTLPENVPGAD